MTYVCLLADDVATELRQTSNSQIRSDTFTNPLRVGEANSSVALSD